MDSSLHRAGAELRDIFPHRVCGLLPAPRQEKSYGPLRRAGAELHDIFHTMSADSSLHRARRSHGPLRRTGAELPTPHHGPLRRAGAELHTMSLEQSFTMFSYILFEFR